MASLKGIKEKNVIMTPLAIHMAQPSFEIKITAFCTNRDLKSYIYVVINKTFKRSFKRRSLKMKTQNT